MYVIPDASDAFKWTGVLFVHRGYFASGVFSFTLSIPTTYPAAPPTVTFQTDCFHPLIDPTSGRFALASRFPSWRPRVDFLFHVLHYLKAAFKRASLDELREASCLNKEAYRLYRDQNTLFAKLAAQSAMLSITDASLFGSGSRGASGGRSGIKFRKLEDGEEEVLKEKLEKEGKARLVRREIGMGAPLKQHLKLKSHSYPHRSERFPYPLNLPRDRARRTAALGMPTATRAVIFTFALLVAFAALAGPIILFSAPRKDQNAFRTRGPSILRASAGPGVSHVAAAGPDEYLLGTGIGDITGPIVGINMMGYAEITQSGTGLHMRQRARAFIVVDGAERILFVNLDCAMGDSGITRAFLAKLEKLYPGVYSEKNVALVGTHAHAGVGGYLENFLPQVTSLGFVPETFDAIVAGAITATQRAHESLAPGRLSLGKSTLLDSNLNRSPTAYLENPAEERARYEYDVDKDFSLLQFNDTATGTSKGFLSFFAVHGTSLNNKNTLISGDNKGMAAFLSESQYDPSSLPGENKFVAGYAQSNMGDVTPNTEGAWCDDPGKPWDNQRCEPLHSTCGGSVMTCHARGPGFPSDYDSNRIIGTNQHEAAMKLMKSPDLTPISGPVMSVHQYVNMASYSFKAVDGSSANLCPAALGHGFAAGTTDGPGADLSTVYGGNATSANPLLDLFIKDGLTPTPSPEQVACHAPKEILFNTGFAHVPYNWSPAIVALQMFRLGQVVIILVPTELTTMAGRRLRESVRNELISKGVIGPDGLVLIGAIANGAYSHYTATREEYQVQRYEGGLLACFSVERSKLTQVQPKAHQQFSDLGHWKPGVGYDGSGLGKRYGQVIKDVRTDASYAAGNTVAVTFIGANPRNDLRHEQSFFTIQTNLSGDWKTVKTDSHPSTTFEWVQTNTVSTAFADDVALP
ncbi:hypothetical protein RQP46_006340 [Phenoliferia psychrophenolica]